MTKEEKARQIVEKIGLGNAYLQLVDFMSDKEFEHFYKDIKKDLI